MDDPCRGMAAKVRPVLLTVEWDFYRTPSRDMIVDLIGTSWFKAGADPQGKSRMRHHNHPAMMSTITITTMMVAIPTIPNAIHAKSSEGVIKISQPKPGALEAGDQKVASAL